MQDSTFKWQFNVISVVLLLMVTTKSELLYGVPAKPVTITVQQADGSQIKLRVNGDEHFSWRTTEEGYPIIKEDDGNYYYASYSTSGIATATTQRVAVNGVMQAAPSTVSNQGMEAIASYANTQQRIAKSIDPDTPEASFPSTGTIRSIVLLVEYADVRFSVDNPNQAFYNQLNQEGYSVSGATGSAKDYFTANSQGQFDGQFDVYGPYTLSNNRSYYGGNDSSGSDLRPQEMVSEAAELADKDGVDFSQYDFDGDGYIDNVFVYYAGHNEAEGASEDTIWPHKWAVSSRPTFDGLRLYIYACSSELRGYTGTTIAGIGTFCHEFSHVFGLADHYDTNGSTNGTSLGLGTYDIMTSGSYNNSGNTPPLHNALELEMIGWTTPTVIDKSQAITLEPIQNGTTYKIETETDGEYFLIENRNINSTVWDNYIAGEGLFITHVDRSSSYMYLWNANGPNTISSHECLRFMVAGQVTLNGYNWAKVPYPSGTNNSWTTDSNPAALSWSNNEVPYNITDISLLDNGNVSFIAIDSNAEPLEVTIESSSEEQLFVGDQVVLTTTISPEDDNITIYWNISNPSIVETSTDGNNLNVKFIEEGSVSFIAIVELFNNIYLSNTLYLMSNVLQGSEGYIYDSNAQRSTPIANATLEIYSATSSATNVSSGAQQSVEYYTRSSNVPNYRVTSDEDGKYRVQLSQGYYQAEISASNYATSYETFYIDKGTNYIDFELSSYADTVDGVTVEANQSDATLTWNPLGYSSFRTVVKLDGDTVQTIDSDESSCTVEDLETSTQYEATISGVNSSNGYDELYTTSFTTLDKFTTIPLIQLEAYEYSAGELLELKVLNTLSSDDITWYMDGEELNLSKVVLEAGEHKIKVVVIRGIYNYTANREIFVK